MEFSAADHVPMEFPMEFLPGFEGSPIAGSLACRRPLKSGLCLATLPGLEEHLRGLNIAI